MGEPSAAVAILRTREPDPRILLMRRAERAGDPWSGHWSLPGGRREKFDDDLLETAVRELEEECGIRLGREQMSAALPLAVARRRVGPFLLVAPFVFDIDSEMPTRLDEREAAGVVWIPQDTLLDPGQHSLRHVPGVPGPLCFPAIPLPGAPLWGFTYRLLVEWLGIAPRDCPAAGFDVARMMLEFVLAQGAELRNGWHSVAARDGEAAGPVNASSVSGPIPAEAVMAHFSAPGAFVSRVNRVEVRPEFIRIHGLAFEEYLIEGAAG